MISSIRRVGLGASVTVMVVAGCAAAADPGSAAAKTAALALTPCHVKDLGEEVRCATLDVYEDRDAVAGRRIPIHVTVLPALVRDPAPDPLVILAGGPGQGARAYAPLVPRFFQRIRRTRDVVLVDLRGTGDSAPLECESPAGAAAFLSAFDAPEASAKRCLTALAVDPRFYTHRFALADLREVVERLGYARVNLWGGSWGTRAALIFAATFTHLVRSAVLDGAVAADLPFPWSFPVDGQRALDLLFVDCAADMACHAAFPDAREMVADWLSRLAREPASGVVRDPRSGGPLRITIDRAAASEILRAAMYSPIEASRVLMVIRSASAGDLAPLVAMADRAARWSIDTMALGQTLTILCSEDVGRHPPAATTAATLFGTGAVDNWVERCRAWPKGPAPDLDERTVLAVPALILSGGLDPVTPPERGEAMRRHFPNSLHIVAPGGSHNVSFSGCIPRLIAAFVEAGSAQNLDASCARSIARPPFVVSPAGTRS